ncbi:MAG: hypothetical protein HQK74_03315 [Desulfamplus sp.]|nr:hypothetical protein [Desulfamplus sp.]
MIAHKSIFVKGAVLLAGFLIVLFAMFMPIFDGHHAINAMDNLYNSISKGSAYYIPGLIKDNEKYKDTQIEVTLKLKSKEMAAETMQLLTKAGATAEQNEDSLTVKGSLGAILNSALEDSDMMFANDGKKIKEKYGYDDAYNEKQILFNWWNALKSTDRDLKHQEKFAESKFIGNVMTRAVECSYNYYKVQAENIKDKVGIVIFSLVFYVVYTIWFGFSIMFLFEGWGMKLSH